MTPQYILRKSLCRAPHCAGPDELRDVPFKDWPADALARYSREATSAIENLNYAPGYAERGYTDPRKAVLFANWNLFSREVGDLLEKAGYETEWEDEWTTCEGCGKALRTSAGSYGWQPSYFHKADGCEYFCKDCADIEAVLESYEDSPTRAFNDHIDPAEYGYEKVEGDFENGWHPGQNDEPKKIYDRLRAAGHKRLLLVIDSVGQFDMQFSIWKKVVEVDASEGAEEEALAD